MRVETEADNCEVNLLMPSPTLIPCSAVCYKALRSSFPRNEGGERTKYLCQIMKHFIEASSLNRVEMVKYILFYLTNLNLINYNCSHILILLTKNMFGLGVGSIIFQIKL